VPRSTLIALDCDGVLLNYNLVYPAVWKRAFGTELVMRDPRFYHACRVYGVDLSDPQVSARFHAAFDEEVWQSIPAMPGAVQACRDLVRRGHELVCVSSMPREFAPARNKNLQALGFPVQAVVATGHGAVAGANPKLEALTRLAPCAFVDDLARNFIGLPREVYKALIEPGHEDSPNVGLPRVHDSAHRSLADFASFWLGHTAAPRAPAFSDG
jgi:FMN phosphatase YigB (HAD superfamily)